MGPDPIIRRDAVDTGRIYMCIDLKSFYASVECADRGLDPFTTNLVVADPSRGDGTICLAATPAIKALGVSSRARVFEIPKDIEYIKAPPRMKRYMEVSAQIYGIYLQRISAQDIHVYSIDECFIDATPYLKLYKTDARSLAKLLMKDVEDQTRICATAGIGTNLFLAKVALDVTAKHVDDHIGFLNEREFRRKIWHHRPITDIWGIGPGIARRLLQYNVRDLAGITQIDERFLHKEFGANAEYLIDHAWGYESCTMADIHNYRPRGHSTSNGQVLMRDYSFAEARNVLREMATASALDLVEKRLACDSVALYVGYSWDDLGAPSAGAARKLGKLTNSRNELLERVLEIYDEITDRDRSVRRLSVSLGGLADEKCATQTLFDDVAAAEEEHSLSAATLAVQRKFGKNALLRGVSLRDEATQRERNNQVGGHRAE